MKKSDKEKIDLAISIMKNHIIEKKVYNEKMIRDYLSLKLFNEKKEVFGCLALNGSKMLLDDQILFTGIVDKCPVYKSEVARFAIQSNCKFLIIYHNHPSMIKKFSKEDFNLTNEMIDMLTTINVVFLDHIIVCGDETISIAELFDEYK